MSKYLKNVVLAADFDGDRVVVTMRPLTFGDLIIIDPLLLAVNEARRQFHLDTTNKVLETHLEKVGYAFMERAYEILPKYVVKIEGLYDNVGSPVLVDDIFNVGYFTELVSNMLTYLRNSSTPTDPQPPGELSTARSPG